MNLSKIVSKLPSTKKYKLICSPNNFYNLSLKSRYPKNIYAAQNIDLHGKGASTGSIDIEDLVNNKIKYCILGHSEVRSNFGETDLIVQKKTDLCLINKIKPIVCIGEPLKIYKSKKTKVFLKKQINKIFKKSNHYEEVVLAYEPLWSIGTGLTPKLSEIDDILGFLSKILENYSFRVAMLDEIDIKRRVWRDRVTNVVFSGPFTVEQLEKYSDEFIEIIKENIYGTEDESFPLNELEENGWTPGDVYYQITSKITLEEINS